jgi:CubicO group peptidase (beta-lactamase class C family)
MEFHPLSGSSGPRPEATDDALEKSDAYAPAPMAGVELLVDEIVSSYPVAGLALGVVTPAGLGETVLRGIAGADRAVERETVFRIGSVTKTMAALALLREWEAGRVDLDAPVNDGLPDLELVGRPGWRAASIRHLLTHTAGIGELAGYRDLFRPMIGLAVPPGTEPLRAPQRYGGRIRLEVEPGTKWAYANHGFNVLGYLLETLTGEPFAEHVRRVIFEPLGMHDTDARRTDAVRAALASGYVVGRRGLRAPRDIDVGTVAAGAVFSTLPDLAAFAAALLDHGRGIVEPATLAMAFDPQYRPTTTHPGIGLSFFRDDLHGHRVVGHSGGIPGFVTAMSIAPDDGVGVVAFSNGNAQALALAAHRSLCQLLGVPPVLSKGRRLQPEFWGDLIGWYRPDRGRLTNARVLAFGGGVEIRRRGNDLVMRALSPFPGLRRGTRFVPLDDTGQKYGVDLTEAGIPPLVVHVDRAGDGGPTALNFGGMALGAMPTLRRTSQWTNPRRRLYALSATAVVVRAARRSGRSPVRRQT